jgi:hypothetical protein
MACYDRALIKKFIVAISVFFCAFFLRVESGNGGKMGETGKDTISFFCKTISDFPSTIAERKSCHDPQSSRQSYFKLVAASGLIHNLNETLCRSRDHYQ